MQAILGLIVTFIVTTISLLIISKLPVVGVEIDSPQKAALSALVIGILNALAWPLLWILKLGSWLTALPLFIVNVIIFGVAAAILPGFRLQNGVVSAIFGALLLTILNTIINHFLPFGDSTTTAMILSGSMG